MQKTLTSILASVLMCALLGAFVPQSFAQSRTLTIRDGEVYIDGRPIPKQELPASLDVRGMNAQYSFTGIAQPVVELDGVLYAVSDSLKPVRADEVQSQGSIVFFRDSFQDNGSSSGRTLKQRSASQRGVQQTSTLSRSLQEQQALRRQYLQDIQRRNEQLYNRLVREHRMDMETRKLAQRIRQLPPGTERQQKIDSLRATLNDIFDLKQENRRREIQQLEAKLEELQRSLEKREQMRDQMIEQRIQQLIGAKEE